jgi:hypothetical protein
MKSKKKVAEVPRLTEVESLRFGKFDAELRNVMQGIQLKEYEIEKAQREYQEKRNSLMNQKTELVLKQQALKPQYVEMVEGLAKKYKMDSTKMTIDPDSGIIREIT